MAETTPASFQQRLQSIPPHLKINILYHDNQIVVINKPNNLRSVPGNAQVVGQKRPRDGGNRLTAQEAWIAALDSFEFHESETFDQPRLLLRNLTTNRGSFASIPRKWPALYRYVQRNQHRLLDCTQKWSTKENKNSAIIERLKPDELEAVAKQVHHEIECRQRTLMNVPESTPHEDSAYGQLVLLGYGGDDGGSKKIHTVHRLDCETSGVMIFALDEHSASYLCNAWRERVHVRKTYLAKVKEWTTSSDQGEISLPLSASDEGVKWRVDPNGKRSTTLWVVKSREQESVILFLTPVTGRTHQLRIHCASLGGGILGDSLYGEGCTEPIADPNDPDSTKLYLHAHKLSVPHPGTGQQLEFTSLPCWLPEGA